MMTTDMRGVMVTNASTSASAERATDCFWLALKPVVAFLATSQATSLFLEICHADSRKSRGGVVLGLVLVDLMDRDSGVDYRGLDGLLLDDGLDGPVTSQQHHTLCLNNLTYSWTWW